MDDVGIFRTTIGIESQTEPGRIAHLPDTLIDTGSEFTWAPRAVVESLPGCGDCAFQSYCGADPIFHYTTQRDLIGHRPTSAFCRRNMAIIRHLFSLLGTGDPGIYRIFFAWIRERGVEEVRSEVAA